jgi:hypothetical protein
LLLRSTLIAAALFSLAACNRNGELDPTGGMRVARSACPAVGIPAFTGDVTLFNPPQSRDAAAIDVVATITNLKTTCDDSGAEIVSTTTFDVLARRTDVRGARQVVLPYFVTVVRGGNVVNSKRVSRVVLDFADGQERASSSGQGSAVVNAAAATLPEDVRRQITRRRKPGEEDAAIDPLSDPAVRQAVARASFEVLLGFQLTPEQLQYNVTR